MSDPAELRVALAEFEVWEVDGSWDSYPAVVGSDINDARIIIAAARERLAQLESGAINTSRLREYLEYRKRWFNLAEKLVEPEWFDEAVDYAGPWLEELLAIKESGSIVITRDAAGNWPEWALPDDPVSRSVIIQYLDTLADSSKAPE